jgi:hypothetical protein
MKFLRLPSLNNLTVIKICVAFLIVLTVSCKSDTKKTEEAVVKEEPNYIEITTRSMEFQSVDTIPSGWNTFKYNNLSNETHFFLLDKYPDSVSIDNTRAEILPVFDRGMDLINQGKPEEGFAAFNDLPAWFFKIVFNGGSGLIAPQHSSITTLKLEPGYYVMECYVKMPNGQFHGSMGMVKEFIVLDTDSGLMPPEATVNISISSTEGIAYEGSIGSGPQVFSVHFKDQITHENFVGHDVNLVKLDANADLTALESWMNWSDPKGLITPVPEGVTFLGGVNDSPAGKVGYFEVNLEPGNYAFISEVPGTMAKGMLKTFTITN